MPPRDDALLDHAEFLRSFARGLLGDPDRAADIVQDTWVAALDRPPRHAKSLRGWLAVVARNFARRAARADLRRSARERRAATPEGLPSAEEVAARLELQRKVVEAVEALEEPYRSTLLLRYFDGFDPAEIARRAGLPVGTVKTRLSRALEKVRARLGERRSWAPLLLPLVLGDTVAAAPAGAVATGVLLTMKKAIVIVAVLVAGLVVLLRVSRGPAEPRRADQAPASERRPSAAASLASEEKAEAAAVERRVEPGAAFVFEGRVVDAEAEGVGGARVRLVYWHSGGYGSDLGHVAEQIRREAERLEGPETVADADGCFRFARRYESHSFLLASADGYAETLSGAHTPGKFVTITLPAAGGVRVCVADPDGHPVAGARVRLASEPREILRRTETDERGEARLPALPAGHFRFRIEVDPREGDLGFVSRPAQEGEIVVVVPRVDCFERRIVDAETGAPIPGAYVVVGEDEFASMEIERRRILADADGRVRIPWQESEKLVRLFASAPGYEHAFAGGDPIRLSRSMRVRGLVIDADGAPLPAVPLFVTAESGWEQVHAGLPLVSAWTDADGRFDLEITMLYPVVGEPVPEPGVRTLVALHGRLAAVIDGLPVQPGRSVDVSMRMPEPAAIEVEVTDAEGAPLAGQDIWITRSIPLPATWPERDARLWLVSLRDRNGPRTGPDGIALIDLLPPGEYELRIDTTVVNVTLAEGERRDVRIVRGAGPRITGVLLDAEGKPLPGERIGLSGPAASSRATDKGGRFVFIDLKPGRYSVLYEKEVFGGWIQVPARPGDDVVLRLPASPAHLDLVVEGPPGEKVLYSLVTKSGTAVPRELGMNRLVEGVPEFPPAEGILVIRAEGFGWTAVRFDAAEGQTTPVRVALPRAGSVRVDLATPPADRKVFVRLVRDDGFPESVTRGDAMLRWGVQRVQGTWGYQVPLGEEIPDVAPGVYQATAGYYAGRGGESWTEIAAARAEVVSERTAEIELVPVR